VARLKVGVLVSGRGSNLQALIDACRDTAFPAEIVLVVSNVADAHALERARTAGIPTRVVSHRDYPDRASFDADLDAALRQAGVQLVCLAGFMRLLGHDFVNSWRDRLINIHPSLLPAFPGLDTHARALKAGVRLAGCTVHFVRPEVDSGPILVQAAVPVRADDSADSLAARVLGAEHRLYPLALRWIAEGRVQVRAERALVAGATAPDGLLINPARAGA
jgi:phosphoribosylglycinamide formyltransferase-1